MNLYLEVGGGQESLYVEVPASSLTANVPYKVAVCSKPVFVILMFRLNSSVNGFYSFYLDLKTNNLYLMRDDSDMELVQTYTDRIKYENGSVWYTPINSSYIVLSRFFIGL